VVGDSDTPALPEAVPDQDAAASVPVIEGQLRIPLADDDPGEQAAAALAEPPPASTDEPPRIRRVWFKNFKGFSDFSVTLGAFNVLAGANNSGKSTLLQGIDLLFALLKLHVEGDRLAASGRLVPPPILPVASVRDLYFRQTWRQANTYVLATVGAEFSDGSSVEFGIRHLFGGANSRVLADNGMNGVRLQALLAKPAVWVPSAVGIVRDEEYRTPARRTALIGGGRHHEILRNLLMDLSRYEDRFELLQRILHDRFGANLAALEFDEARDQFVSADYADGSGTQHDLYSAGAGFVQVTQLLAFILGRGTSIVLLDEPDAHLHSSLQRVVVEILDEVARQEGFQVVLATHSKEIINFVDPTRLILVESGAAAAAPVSDEVTPMAVLRSLGAIDNVDAYALVRNRRCLFVEGSGDSTILGRFAATLGIQALTGDDRVVTVPVGGADRFEHVQQLEVFEGLLGGHIGSLELRDRDGMTPEHRQATMDDSDRELLIWERDSIESYLIQPSVIARVVSEISAERGSDSAPSEQDIADLIDEETEKLKENTQDRVSQRYADDMWRREGDRVAIPAANERGRELVEASWTTQEDRLQLVSGKRLLSAIRKEIQDRYGVNFGNERLAEAFTAEEIPAEVAEALQRVVQLQVSTPGT
jgi:energy-coupling factor transporter ATP-binding protein EcfA2